MLTVNLFDDAFRHLVKPDGRFSVVHGKIPENVRYVNRLMSFPGTTVFTEHHAVSGIAAQVRSGKKIAWLLENRALNPGIYQAILQKLHLYDTVLTHDEQLIAANPSKIKFVPFGGCWIDDRNMTGTGKTSNISMILSGKNYLPGHQLRHRIKSSCTGIEYFGHGVGKSIPHKDGAICPYRFHVVVENVSCRSYFTEKLVDALVTKSIPIFWGCENIGDFFDARGILRINDERDLLSLIPKCNETLYNEMLPFAEENHRRAMEYRVTEDWIFKHGLY